METKSLLSEELPPTESWMCCVTGSPNTRRYSSPFPSILFLVSFLPSVALQKKKKHFCNDSAVVLQDFELNTELKMRVIGFLEEVMHDPELLTQERKAAANIIRSVFLFLSLDRTYSHMWHICMCPVEEEKFLQYPMPAISHGNQNWSTGDTVHQTRSWPKSQPHWT